MEESRLSLKEQVIAAKRDKYLAEARKADAEKLKIDLEYKEAKEESLKKWWFKKDSRKIIVTAISSLIFIGFYIEYAVLPAYNIKNLEATLENKKTAMLLFEREQQIKKDSLSIFAKSTLLAKQARHLDSANAISNLQNFQINQLKATKHKVDSTYFNLVKLYSQSQDFNTTEVKGTIKKLKQYLDEYKLQKGEYVTSINTVAYPFSSNRTGSLNSLAGYSGLQVWDGRKDINSITSFTSATVNVTGITKYPTLDSMIAKWALKSLQTPTLANLGLNPSWGYSGLASPSDTLQKYYKPQFSPTLPLSLPANYNTFHLISDTSIFRK